ncbi:TetR/AcrR family transcriptional regulator [Amycolatopsis sp. NPDC058986]|uniref:TetR/AcrR family transcriptional regulator n=1 Tax=unclassified Amycolatopsis TaxID=2618356 RepID=UPI00366E8035
MATEHCGGGDPDKVLPLLWRTSRPEDGRPVLGRRPGLNVDEVLAAALDVADVHGLSVLSMSKVAKSLGVGTMTLYTYVPGKAELIDLMVDRVLRERALPLGNAPKPKGWRAQLELYADRTRTMFRDHAWLGQVSLSRPPLGPGVMDGDEYLLSALSGLGLTPQERVAAANAVQVVVDAICRVEVTADQLERTSGESNDDWWAERMSFWNDYFDPQRYPEIFASWRDNGFEGLDALGAADVYRFGFQRLLDGIHAVIMRASGG